MVVREDLILALRVRREALLGVELGEALVDVEARGVEPVDPLVDRDPAQEEPVAREVLGDPGQVRDRLLVAVEARVEVPDLVQDVDVARRLLEDLQIILESRIDLTLLEAFLGRCEERIAFRARHGSGRPGRPGAAAHEDAVEGEAVLRARSVAPERREVLGRRIAAV